MAVNSIPILVDLTALGFGGPLYGPFSSGANLYIVIAEPNIAGYQVAVFKSVDDGSTWVSQDTGNQPLVGNPFLVIFDGTDIHMISKFVDFPAPVLEDSRYSIGSDTFTPPVGFIVPHDGAVFFPIPVLRSDGAIVVLYLITDAGIPALYFNVINAGSWGTEALIVQGTGVATDPNQVFSAIPDALDVTHFIWNDLAASLFYGTIDSGGVVAASIAFPIAEFTFNAKALLFGSILAFGTNGSIDNRAKIVFAAGATSNPSTAIWTETDAWSGTLPAGSIEENNPQPILDGSGDLQLVITSSPPAFTTNSVYSVRWNGTSFDAPVVFYDPVAFPPPGTVSDVFISSPSLQLVSGTFRIAFAASYGGTTPSTFYAFDGSTPPTLDGYYHAMY